MNRNSRAFLQLPQGTESFYLEEALEHERIVELVRRLAFSWGYLPVQTPVFDFYDIYRPFLDSAAAEKVYRLVDRDGDLLMLRSDITLFLAKQLGRLESRELPLRVFYADTILRHQDAEDISRNEFYQIGAELIGEPGFFADLEVLLLLVRCLEEAGLAGYRVHLGSREVFAAALPDLEDAGTAAALAAVALRDTAPMREILLRAGKSGEETAFLLELFLYIGDARGLRELTEKGKARGFVGAELEKSIESLTRLWRELEDLRVSGVFRLDVSEPAGQNYYTGIVFQAYKDGIDSAFASGGRYDKLLARFGFDAPAVGFSLMLRKIEGELPAFQSAAPRVFESVTGATFAEAFRAAEEKRKAGKPIVVSAGGKA